MLISYVDDGGASTEGTACFLSRFLGNSSENDEEKDCHEADRYWRFCACHGRFRSAGIGASLCSEPVSECVLRADNARDDG